MTKILASPATSIGLLGACAFAGDTGPETALCRAWSPRTPMEAAR